MDKPDEDQKRILILEDNQDILDLLTDWLTSIGYEVWAYSNVSDIISLVKDKLPDLIMLDYLLGGVNGGEYCAQLKKNPETGHVPVIMLSAHQRVIDSLGHYGWDMFISKPFDLKELSEKISSLIHE